MLYTIIKFFISAVFIVLISEVAKRSSLLGGFFASLPVVSLLAMIWLYIDTKNVEAVALLSRDIFWLVIPSLLLFVTLPIFLNHKIHFYISLGIACLITVIAYVLSLFLLKKFHLS